MLMSLEYAQRRCVTGAFTMALKPANNKMRKENIISVTSSINANNEYMKQAYIKSVKCIWLQYYAG